MRYQYHGEHRHVNLKYRGRHRKIVTFDQLLIALLALVLLVFLVSLWFVWSNQG